MTTSPPNAPWYRSRWFWLLALLIAGLRVGYKLWRPEQPSNSQARLEAINIRNQSLKERLKAAEAASPTTVVRADSALLTDTTAATR